MIFTVNLPISCLSIFVYARCTDFGDLAEGELCYGLLVVVQVN